MQKLLGSLLIIGALAVGVLIPTDFSSAATKVPPGCEGIEGTPRCGFLDDVPGIETATGVVTTFSEASGECAESYKNGSTLDYIGCTIGGAITKGFGGLFSFKNLFWFTSGVGWLLLMVAQMFMGWAAWWLDGSIYYMMVLMGFYINHEASAKGIQYAWSVVRDLTNILIIAGFVGVGISTILQVSQYAADKFLARLIIAALLVNFSYFIAGAVIDATNYIGIQIYNSDLLTSDCEVDSQSGTGIDPFGKPRGDGTTITGPMRAIMALNDDRICNVARSMASYSGITTVDNVDKLARRASNVDASALGPEWANFNQPSWDPKNAKSDPATNYYFMFTLLSFMGAAFAFILGYVFTKGAIFLIVRFAALILLLVTSPLGIAGSNVPFIGQYVARWWGALISQAVFAPVFIFLFAVGLSIVKQFAEVFNPVMQNGQSVAMSDAFFAAQHAAGQGLIGYVPIFITYFLAVIMTYLAYMVSAQIANSVGELKGLYDTAANYAWSAYMSPKNLAMKTPLIGGNAIQGYIDAAASRAREGSIARMIGTGLSAGFRGIDRLGSGKKNEKSVWEEADTNIRDTKKSRRESNLRTQIESGFFGQSAFSGQLTGIANKPKDKLQEADIKKAHAFYKDQDPEEVRDRVGERKFNEMSAKGLFPDNFLEKVNNSAAFTAAQKAQFNQAYFSEIIDHADNKRWDAAAEGIEGLSDIERQILFAERKEVRGQQELLSRLKSDTFQSGIKNMSPADRKVFEDARASGQRTALIGTKEKPATLATQARAVKGMSDKERAGLDYDSFVAAAPHMNAAQMRHVYANTADQRVRDHITGTKEYNDMLKGPGVEPEKK